MLHFRRITTHDNFIPQIDGLRFVAIASVILFHIYSALQTRSAVPVPWPENLDLAKRGVELFFAISGFILGIPFASARFLNTPKVNLKQYFLRRLTRLEPPYIISLFVCVAANWVTVHQTLSHQLPHLLSSCFYMQNLMFGGFEGAVNSVAWSLEVEVQFYLLVPFFVALFGIASPRKRRIVILLLMLVLGVLSLPLYRSTHFHYSIGYYLSFFLAGLLLCDLYVNRGEWKVSLLWDCAAIILWPLVWTLGRNLGHVLLPFAIVALYITAFRGRMCSAIFCNSVITSIGGMCYSIYLFHFLVIYAVKHVVQPIHFGQNFWFYFILQVCMIVPFILVLCGGFFLVIERPCMDRKWPVKLWRWCRELLALKVSRSANCNAASKATTELVGL
jgi:peptidoglycan/LPS O-acetylase OafA/YrhL